MDLGIRVAVPLAFSREVVVFGNFQISRRLGCGFVGRALFTRSKLEE